MENASKALLIAGAILLILAIISLAVMIFGKGRIFVDNMDKQLSQSDIDNHNSRFTRFEGIISGVEVKNACTAVAQVNEKNKAIKMKITVAGVTEYPKNNENESKEAMKIIMNNILNTQMFEGKLIYNSSGIIDTLIFNKK